MSKPIKILIGFAWWFPIYMQVLRAICWLSNSEPDEKRLEKVISKAVRVK